MNKQEILTRYSKEEEKLLVSKVLDKIEFVLNRNTIENTDFLDLYQKELVKELLRSIKFNNYIFCGGNENAEREILIVFPEKLKDILKEDKIIENILKVIQITLPNELTGEYNHRDYLGGIIKLGLKREKIGDILVRKNGADIIIIKDVEEYLLTN